MNEYKMKLVFPEVSASIPVIIKGNSAEEVLDKIQAGEDTKLNIESGCSDEHYTDTVSRIYVETIRVSAFDMSNISTLISANEGKKSTISNEVCFPDGMEMDIMACSGNPGWAEAVLFLNGCECGCTDVKDVYEGVWFLCHDEVMYVAVVVSEN